MTFFAFVSSVEVSAKPKKAKYGIIKIQSDPGGLLVTIDGVPRGETVKNDYRSIQLDAGMHTVSVTLPNGKLWTREIEVPAGRVKCVNVNYRPLPPMAKSPCPYPVNVSAPQTVNEGEIITFAADVFTAVLVICDTSGQLIQQPRRSSAGLERRRLQLIRPGSAHSASSRPRGR